MQKYIDGDVNITCDFDTFRVLKCTGECQTWVIDFDACNLEFTRFDNPEEHFKTTGKIHMRAHEYNFNRIIEVVGTPSLYVYSNRALCNWGKISTHTEKGLTIIKFENTSRNATLTIESRSSVAITPHQAEAKKQEKKRIIQCLEKHRLQKVSS